MLNLGHKVSKDLSEASESIFSSGRRRKSWMEKNTQPASTAGKKASSWSRYVGFFFFFSSPFSLFHPHTYTWESRQLMCCLWWQREAYINSKKTMMKGQRKGGKWVQNGISKRMALYNGSQTVACWGFEALMAAKERLRALTMLARRWRWLRLAQSFPSVSPVLFLLG